MDSPSWEKRKNTTTKSIGFSKKNGAASIGIQNNLPISSNTRQIFFLLKYLTNSAPGIWVSTLASHGSAPSNPIMVFDAPSASANATRKTEVNP